MLSPKYRLPPCKVPHGANAPFAPGGTGVTRRPGGVSEVLVGVSDVCVDDADEGFLLLPVVAQLRQPVEVVDGADGLPVQLCDHVAGVNVDHDQRSERDPVVFRQRSTHQVHDVRQLSLTM